MVIRRIREHISTHNWFTRTDVGNGLIIPRMPAKCSIGLNPSLAADVASKIRSEPGLASDLTRMLVALDSRILNFGKLESTAREVRQFLERTLD